MYCERMLPEDQLRAHARTASLVLSMHGPSSPHRVMRLLRKLGLDESDAADVVAYGLAERVIVTAGERLRAGPGW
jgi:hypothetical protein